MPWGFLQNPETLQIIINLSRTCLDLPWGLWICWWFVITCEHSCFQVASPTLKGKHCLLTSFVKGAGFMEGIFSSRILESLKRAIVRRNIRPTRNFKEIGWVVEWKVPGRLEMEMVLVGWWGTACTIPSTPSSPPIGTSRGKERCQIPKTFTWGNSINFFFFQIRSGEDPPAPSDMDAILFQILGTVNFKYLSS